jgi:hypothetical protein
MVRERQQADRLDQRDILRPVAAGQQAQPEQHRPRVRAVYD